MKEKPRPKIPGIKGDRASIEKYIRENVDDFGCPPCLFWTGPGITKSGYGTMRIDAAIFSVNRIIWWLHHGYLPQGQYMSTSCGDKLCGFIGHIQDATPENERRTTLFRPGKAFNQRVLTPEQEQDIWMENRLEDMSYKQLAKKYRVSVNTIHRSIQRTKTRLQQGTPSVVPPPLRSKRG